MPDIEERKVVLYDLSNEMKSLEQLLQMDGGEMTPEFKALHDEVTQSISLKVDGYLGYIRMLEDDISIADNRIKDLRGFIEVRKNRIQRMKDYALAALDNAGENSFRGELGQISKRKGQPTVEILDESKLPLDFVTFEKTTKIDKQGLKKALQAEGEIPGCKLNEAKYSVQFKRKSVKGE